MIAERLGWTPRLLPPDGGRVMAFLPWVLALMVYVAALSGAGLIVLYGTLRAAERSLGTALTLQLPADASSSELSTIMALLGRTKGIRSAHLFEAAETRRLLEPWLGPAVPLDELPVPRLIDVRIDPAAPPDLANLRHELDAALPQARLDDHRGDLASTLAAGHRVEIVLAAVIAAALLLIALSAVFAVRNALSIRRTDIEVLHLLGASDAAIAGRFAARYLGLGLLGGAVGALAAIVTIAALGQVGNLIQLPAPAVATGVGDWRFWAVPFGLAAVAGVIAMASAQLIVQRWLARMP